MKNIDVDELFNSRIIMSELEYSLNDDDKIDASGFTEEKHKHHLLQKYYKNLI